MTRQGRVRMQSSDVSHADGQDASSSLNDADANPEGGEPLAKRPCPGETWTVRRAGYTGGSLKGRDAHIDMEVNGEHTRMDGPIRTTEHFMVQAKTLDAAKDAELSVRGREFYGQTKLSFTLWTIREGWGEVEAPASASVVDDEPSEGVVSVPLALLGSDTPLVPPAPPAPPAAPAPRLSEWLRRRDFVQITGFDMSRFGGVRWIDISNVDVPDAPDAVDVPLAQGSEVGRLRRYDLDNERTKRMHDIAATHVRTAYVSDRLVSMGVTIAHDKTIRFEAGALGSVFRAVGSNEAVSVPAPLLTKFVEQCVFVDKVVNEWASIGLSVPMWPFPFGTDSDEQQAFAHPAPGWYGPVSEIGLQEALRQASTVTPRDDSVSHRHIDRLA